VPSARESTCRSCTATAHPESVGTVYTTDATVVVVVVVVVVAVVVVSATRRRIDSARGDGGVRDSSRVSRRGDGEVSGALSSSSEMAE
jgi:hypothetical protein